VAETADGGGVAGSLVARRDGLRTAAQCGDEARVRTVARHERKGGADLCTAAQRTRAGNGRKRTAARHTDRDADERGGFYWVVTRSSIIVSR
jgi:hypothetical protein